MKNLNLLIAVAGVALASCSFEEKMDWSMAESNDQITFEAPVVGLPTKAAIEDATFPTTADFAVSAIWLESGTFGSDAANSWGGTNAKTYMTKVVMTSTDKTVESTDYKTWTSATPYYWPKQGKLTFQAYSPATLTPLSFDKTGLNLENHTVATDVDIMYSNRAVDQTKANQIGQTYPADPAPKYYGVQLTFHHALSYLKFAAKKESTLTTEYPKITLTGITLHDMYKTGDFVQGIAAGATNVHAPAWTKSATAALDSYNILSSGSLVLHHEIATTNAQIAPILVMPQLFVGESQDAKFTIEYTLQSDAAATPIPQNFEIALKDLAYNDAAATGFEVGKKYTFNIIIGLEQIYFAPEVTDWTGVEVEHTASNTPWNLE